MFDSKFLFTLIGLIVAIFAISNINTNKTPIIKEGFAGLNTKMTFKVGREVASSREAMAKGDIYSVPGTYQSMLHPRFSNINYGANINYNMPSYKNQAVPRDPLSFGDMVKNDYSRENFTQNTKENYGCRKGGAPLSFHGGAPENEPNYAAGNYNDVLEQEYSNAQYPETDSLIPVGDMTTVNALGETIQPIVYDRYIFANRNSRLRAHGDPIRGDLAIAPCKEGWFRPSVHPNIDLQEGAMNIMGGVNNETSNQLADLIYTSSGGGQSNIGGVNMSGMFNSELTGPIQDVTISAFS